MGGIILDDPLSFWVPVLFGVPQGSVPGPLLYILFTANISRLFPKHSAFFHHRADDIEADIYGPPQFLALSSTVESLAAKLESWMSSNSVTLNPSQHRRRLGAEFGGDGKILEWPFRKNVNFHAEKFLMTYFLVIDRIFSVFTV